jgi:hypothetical protein
MLFGSIWLANSVTGYNITRGLIIDRAQSDFLSRTPDASNRDTWTFSTWIKLGDDGSNELGLFSGGADINNSTRLVLDASRNLKYQHFDSGTTTDHVGTTQVFRDTSAWQHIVLAVDTTQSTEAHRVRIYVNGSEVTSFGTSNYPAQNADTDVNTADVHLIGSDEQPNYFNGYMTEIAFIDGAQLAASSFGEFDGDSGIWVPIDISGLTYGTNGFLLQFKGENIGTDTSGNSNTWTSNSLGSNNIFTDSCSNIADETVALYPALDPITKNSSVNLTNRNLTHTGTDGDIDTNTKINFVLPSTGKFYFEMVAGSSSGVYLGVAVGSCASNESGNGANKGFLYNQNGKFYANPITASSGDAYGNTWTTNDVIGVAIDMTNGGDMWFSKNDTWQSSATASEIAAGTTTNAAVTNMPTNTTNSRTYDDSGLFVAIGDSSASGTGTLRFASSSWTGTAPTGFGELTQTMTGVGNWSTWSPIHHNHVTAGGTLTNGNLNIVNTGNNIVFSTHKGSGKQYLEFKIINSSSFAGSRLALGIMSPYVRVNQDQSMLAASGGTFSGVSLPDYQAYENGSSVSEDYDNLTAGQTLCMAIDFDAGKMWTRVNSAAFDNKTSGTGNPVNGDHPTLTFTAAVGFPYVYCTFCFDSSDEAQTNFGQKPFQYAPPTGYKGVFSTSNTTPTITKPSEYFAPIGYTGNATDDTAIAVGFQPDFVLIKNRDQTDPWKVIDSVRGATKNLPIKAAVENTEAAGLKAFTSTGFTLGTGASGYNDNSEKFISYNWIAGGAPTADNSGSAGGEPTSGSVMVDGSANTADLAGSKAALRISANTTNGFAIVRWDSSANAAVTIDHKLGKVPKMYWVKALDQDYGWYVYHEGIANTHYLLLTGENAKADEAYWNDATPTTTVFSVSSAGGLEGVNHSGKDFIAYLWADVEGFSKLGSYTGNGDDDGPFIYTDFKPAIFIIKRTDSTGAWQVYDNVRDPYNFADYRIWLEVDSANASNGEGKIDFLSNGVKIRENQTWLNTSGGTYVFAAWAESPFASNNRAR